MPAVKSPQTTETVDPNPMLTPNPATKSAIVSLTKSCVQLGIKYGVTGGRTPY